MSEGMEALQRRGEESRGEQNRAEQGLGGGFLSLLRARNGSVSA